MTRRRFFVIAAIVGALACSHGFEGGGELRARKKILEREVVGLREAVARLERHEALLPAGDVAVGIDEALLQRVIAAQLPFEAAVEPFELRLEEAEVLFRGAPVVRLRGRLKRKGSVELTAVVNVLGALDRITVAEGGSALGARITVDHLGIEKASGMEAFLSGASLDEVARTVRLQVVDKLPPVEIPVRIQQSIELPAVTTGPVRLHGALLPISANVSEVFAGQGRLWVGIHVESGALAETKDAPEVEDARAGDVETGFDGPPPAKPAHAGAKAKAKQP